MSMQNSVISPAKRNVTRVKDIEFHTQVKEIYISYFDL